MINTKLYIIRGLQGSGKTTLAHELVANHTGLVIEADDFFINPNTGAYEFDPSKLTLAHRECLLRTRRTLEACLYVPTAIAVANTFSRRWEYEPYIKLANALGVQYSVITVHPNCSIEELARRNRHNCPVDVIRRTAERWEGGLV